MIAHACAIHGPNVQVVFKNGQEICLECVCDKEKRMKDYVPLLGTKEILELQKQATELVEEQKRHLAVIDELFEKINKIETILKEMSK